MQMKDAGWRTQLAPFKMEHRQSGCHGEEPVKFQDRGLRAGSKVPGWDEDKVTSL